FPSPPLSRPEAARSLPPPRRDQRSLFGSLVPPDDPLDRGRVLRPGSLDGQRLHCAREKCFPDDRVPDDEEHVRRVAPKLPLARVAHFLAELPPGRTAEGAVALGIGAAESRSERATDGVVDDEAVGACLDEGKL